MHLGVGVGWCKEEFDATGQAFHDRGRRLDDMIPALRALWNEGWVEHHGPHYDVGPLQMRPVPAEPVPIYVGGHSDAGAAARRRARRRVDRRRAPTTRTTPGTISAARRAARPRRAGRSDPFTIYLSLAVPPAISTVQAVRGRRRHRHGLRAVDAGQADEGADYRSDLDAKLRRPSSSRRTSSPACDRCSASTFTDAGRSRAGARGSHRARPEDRRRHRRRRDRRTSPPGRRRRARRAHRRHRRWSPTTRRAPSTPTGWS